MTPTEDNEIHLDQIYDLNAFTLLDLSFVKSTADIKSDALLPVTLAYVQNLTRAFSIARFLPYTVGLACVRDR